MISRFLPLGLLSRSGSFLAALLLAVLSPGIAPAQTTNVLHTFSTGGLDDDGLLLGSDGNYYGLVRNGGGYSVGAFYRLTPTGTHTSIYEWNGSEGVEPNSLILGSDGNFYGTTARGGAYDYGTFFRVSPGGVFEVLAEFSGGWEGKYPDHLVQGNYGNLYATTEGGGPYDEGRVVAFVEGFDGTNYTWSIYGMCNLDYATTGVTPTDLLLGSDGYLYGTTATGGQYGYGSLYQVDELYTTTSVVHAFGAYYGDGESPTSIVEVASGQIVGFTASGGYAYGGVVFAYSGGGVSTVLDLDASTGTFASSAPVLGSDGHLYGTLRYGGTSYGGTLYRLEFDFSTYAFNLDVLHDFSTSGSVGYSPASPLLETTSGSFLGTTTYGSPAVFKFTP